MHNAPADLPCAPWPSNQSRTSAPTQATPDGATWTWATATVDRQDADTAQDEGTTQDGKTVPPGQAKKQKSCAALRNMCSPPLDMVVCGGLSCPVSKCMHLCSTRPTQSPEYHL